MLDPRCPSTSASNSAAHQENGFLSLTVDTAATNQRSVFSSASVDSSVPCSLLVSGLSKEHLTLDIEPPQGVPKNDIGCTIQMLCDGQIASSAKAFFSANLLATKREDRFSCVIS